ncbi:AhpC/TSA family protein [Acidisoma cellulosilytica]|uniref:thioredoxin-dependent peroxiredoxin n=1 Tax=Acidisoma cellulosilyticum TaxID=2802395 RepID=A0A963YXJ4_9PROT|nr:peroxiredoxin-like family protein [Acidisoma cellulosilyticum]MCB8878694.1 AhpC/TSA family protein [Acidisoma cellulosilyticum]
MKSLNAQLAAFKMSVFERADKDTARVLRELEAEYRADAAKAKSLTVGDRAPDFTLDGADGERHQLANYAAQGPVFVLFFKGGWCPYSTLTLRAWEDIAPAIRRAGGSILAVSPQKISRAALVQENNGVSFPILGDSCNKVGDAFGIVSNVKPMSRDLLTKLGCDLTDENCSGDLRLPHAAEFLVDGEGIIRFAHVAPVHFERTEPRDALAALLSLRAKAMAHA